MVEITKCKGGQGEMAQNLRGMEKKENVVGKAQAGTCCCLHELSFCASCNMHLTQRHHAVQPMHVHVVLHVVPTC